MVFLIWNWGLNILNSWHTINRIISLTKKVDINLKECKEPSAKRASLHSHLHKYNEQFQRTYLKLTDMSSLCVQNILYHLKKKSLMK